jgi:hypothetical protein
MNLEIGQKVKWQNGTITCRGIFLQEIDSEKSEVVMYDHCGKKTHSKVIVITQKLVKE